MQKALGKSFGSLFASPKQSMALRASYPAGHSILLKGCLGKNLFASLLLKGCWHTIKKRKQANCD